MRDPKLEKELLAIAKKFPTLGQFRQHASGKALGVVNTSKGQPDEYPSSMAVDDYLTLLD